MLKLKELLNTAKSELKDLSSLENPDFRLEQAQFRKDEKIWDIVVSYLVENTNPRNLPIAGLNSDFKYHRMYKQLKIDESQNIVGLFIYDK